MIRILAIIALVGATLSPAPAASAQTQQQPVFYGFRRILFAATRPAR